MMHVYTNGTDFYVAESSDQASELYERDTGCKDEKWEQLPDLSPLVVHVEDENAKVTRTAVEWADAMGYTGMLASKDLG